MTLNGLFAGLRRRWLIVIAFGIVGVLGALLFNSIVLPQYKADARVFVTLATPSTTTTTDRVAGNAYAVQATAAYVEVATSDEVLQGVIDGLGLTDTIEELAKRVEVTSEPDSVVISVSATDPSPEQAATLANTMVTQFSQAVAENEAPTDGVGAARIELQVLRQAIAPESPVTGGLFVLLALGLLAGLVIGLGVAIVLASFDRRIRTGADIRSAIDRPLLGVVPTGSSNVPELLKSANPPARYSSLAFEVASLARTRALSSFLVAPANTDTPHAAAAVLLAKALAGLGSSTVVVDATADGSAFGSVGEGKSGVREILAGQASIDSVLLTGAAGSVDLLPAGRADETVGVSPTALKELVQTLDNVYDFVVVVAGELGGALGTFAFREVVDGAIIVVREGKLESPKLGAGVHWVESAGTPVLGAVMMSRHVDDAPAVV